MSQAQEKSAPGSPAVLRSIVCVDDERDILEVAKMCLEVVGGFEVTCCESGQAALEVLAHQTPDLILLDVMMPQMNGPETLIELRKRPHLKGVPVAFMTARVQPIEVKAYLKLGATGVIPKPFDPMQLSGEVRKIWEAFHG
ncbi:MAG TPA: response regulator [Asticcacaulis sp.]|nr:response regulator [Asticcacaulis sp.]